MTDLQSILDKAKADAAALAERLVELESPDLDMRLVCAVPSNGLQVEGLMSRAEKRGVGKNTRFNRALLAAQVREIHKCGVLIEGEDGEPLRFSDPELWRGLGVHDASEAVVAMIGSDIEIGRLAGELGASGDGDGSDPI